MKPKSRNIQDRTTREVDSFDPVTLEDAWRDGYRFVRRELKRWRIIPPSRYMKEYNVVRADLEGDEDRNEMPDD